ncbi:LamG domain-containing protein [Akkermansiaceae bacterium]|nr:LamG domain-containing protein [Akkermansiaceae bacterium]
MKKQLLIPAFLMAASLSANAAGIHTGLLNYWALDGDGDDSASDFAEGNSTVEDNLTAGGTAGAVTILSTGGLFGGAADFERQTGNDGRLAASDSVDVDFGGESISVSLWAQFEDDDSGNWQSLLAKGEGSNYRISTNRRTSADNANAAFGAGDLDSGVNIQDDMLWHHIVVAATTGSPVQIYVDGALANTGGNSNIVEAGNNFSGELWIGNNSGASAGNPPMPSPVRMWDGLIDDVAQWDRELTASEISTIYNEGLAGNSLGAITIPEPSSITLALIAGLGLLRRRR